MNQQISNNSNDGIGTKHFEIVAVHEKVNEAHGNLEKKHDTT
jgi:hypothetical protein